MVSEEGCCWVPQFQYQSLFPFSQQAVFNWHLRPGAFVRLTPPWERVRLLQSPRSLQNGERAVVQIALGPSFSPLWLSWCLEHEAYDPPHQFQDRQVTGPFAHWVHTHAFAPGPVHHSKATCQLTDAITYRLPMGPLGQLAGGWVSERKLQRMFRYRHAVTGWDLEAHAWAASNGLQPSTPIDWLSVGPTLSPLAKQLVAFLCTGGHSVRWSTDSSTTPAAPENPSRPDWLPPSAVSGADYALLLMDSPLSDNQWASVLARLQRATGYRRVLVLLTLDAVVASEGDGSGLYQALQQTMDQSQVPITTVLTGWVLQASAGPLGWAINGWRPTATEPAPWLSAQSLLTGVLALLAQADSLPTGWLPLWHLAPFTDWGELRETLFPLLPVRQASKGQHSLWERGLQWSRRLNSPSATWQPDWPTPLPQLGQAARHELGWFSRLERLATLLG